MSLDAAVRQTTEPCGWTADDTLRLVEDLATALKRRTFFTDAEALLIEDAEALLRRRRVAEHYPEAVRHAW